MTPPTDDGPEDGRADRLKQSWVANADAWRDAVRERRIESQEVATDAAVLGAVLDADPTRVLDVGCGEGWLCRVLAEGDVEAVGVDASEPLIDAARGRGGGPLHVASYAEIADDPIRLGSAYDVIACNFALLDEELQPLLRALHALCTPAGRLVIQTVHPWTACGNQSYTDGWRTEDFRDLGGAFDEPMPWYFRTLGSWIAALHKADWQIRALNEPRHPKSGTLLSLLLTCSSDRE